MITSSASGPGSSTLPIFVFGQVKRGASPETDAVATMMLAVTLAMLVIGQIPLSWSSRRSGGGQSGGMAGMVAERGWRPVGPPRTPIRP